MDIQEARDILVWEQAKLSVELSVYDDYEKQQLYDAINLAVHMFDKEIANLKGE